MVSKEFYNCRTTIDDEVRMKSIRASSFARLETTDDICEFTFGYFRIHLVRHRKLGGSSIVDGSVGLALLSSAPKFCAHRASIANFSLNSDTSESLSKLITFLVGPFTRLIASENLCI